MTGFREPVVAGVAGGVGTTTLALALHGRDVGTRTVDADILVCGSSAESLERAARIADLMGPGGRRPVLAVTVDGAERGRCSRLAELGPGWSAVVLLPHVARWRAILEPHREAAGLLGTVSDRLPRDLRPYLAAITRAARAVADSGRLAAPYDPRPVTGGFPAVGARGFGGGLGFGEGGVGRLGTARAAAAEPDRAAGSGPIGRLVTGAAPDDPGRNEPDQDVSAVASHSGGSADSDPADSGSAGSGSARSGSTGSEPGGSEPGGSGPGGSGPGGSPTDGNPSAGGPITGADAPETHRTAPTSHDTPPTNGSGAHPRPDHRDHPRPDGHPPPPFRPAGSAPEDHRPTPITTFTPSGFGGLGAPRPTPNPGLRTPACRPGPLDPPEPEPPGEHATVLPDLRPVRGIRIVGGEGSR